jgi:hypothetical protein
MAKVFLDNDSEFFHTFITYSFVRDLNLISCPHCWGGGVTYGVVE